MWVCQPLGFFFVFGSPLPFPATPPTFPWNLLFLSPLSALACCFFSYFWVDLQNTLRPYVPLFPLFPPSGRFFFGQATVLRPSSSISGFEQFMNDLFAQAWVAGVQFFCLGATLDRSLSYLPLAGPWVWAYFNPLAARFAPRLLEGLKFSAGLSLLRLFGRPTPGSHFFFELVAFYPGFFTKFLAPPSSL